MMNSKKQSNYLLLALAMSATLAACGGGDSGKGSLPAADPIADYMGGIAQTCGQDRDIKIGATMPYRQMVLSSPVKVSPTKATYTATLSVYIASTCTGTPMAVTSVAAAKPESIEVVGTKKVGEFMVDKIIHTQGVLFPGISAKTITINGVTFSGAYVNTTPTAQKDIALWEGNDLYTGDMTKAFGADGYPTVLLDSPSDSTMH